MGMSICFPLSWLYVQFNLNDVKLLAKTLLEDIGICFSVYIYQAISLDYLFMPLADVLVSYLFRMLDICHTNV